MSWANCGWCLLKGFSHRLGGILTRGRQSQHDAQWIASNYWSRPITNFWRGRQFFVTASPMWKPFQVHTNVVVLAECASSSRRARRSEAMRTRRRCSTNITRSQKLHMARFTTFIHRMVGSQCAAQNNVQPNSRETPCFSVSLTLDVLTRPGAVCKGTGSGYNGSFLGTVGISFWTANTARC